MIKKLKQLLCDFGYHNYKEYEKLEGNRYYISFQQCNRCGDKVKVVNRWHLFSDFGDKGNDEICSSVQTTSKVE
jgi:hypothetical protein